MKENLQRAREQLAHITGYMGENDINQRNAALAEIDAIQAMINAADAASASKAPEVATT